jgi:hypothetical protein
VQGDLQWDAREFAYVLAPDPSGRNRIERWVDGVLDRVICRQVETLTVDSNVSAPVEVPFGCLRIRVLLGGESKGRPLSWQGELTIRVPQVGAGA